ncbi:DUF2326 domain-containing protein [Neisseria chenwenguii]|uniref:DUF2326 domain-containing protein n=1 Tax=Neisseria chenwenguii TaxID=1853278 RepID=UPI000F4D61F4|nr:DUF2326 domain-containing protein [Neisseria chenwenguii]ROV55346.1 DUF2326 domain-containing protein [Neisseria chenwenguii]
MKLSKLYSNLPDKFSPIIFNDELNFIYGEIRHPENKTKDTHNLGKTTLARLLDFMFLAKRHKEQFLFKNQEIFNEFIFFLEIKLSKNEYLTIKRSVENNTKIGFYLHNSSNQDYRTLPEDSWHELPSFDKAKTYLDGKLNFTAIKSWQYRQLIGYLIRTQDDFYQVFQLKKYRGKDIDWKPYMADLLGFNGELAKQRYQVTKQIDDLELKIKEQNVSDDKKASEELSRVDGRLLIRKNELYKLKEFVENFNFREVDKQTIEDLVSEIDDQIITLNMREYSLKNSIYHIEQSFSENKIKFNPKEVKELFDEVNILFPEQIKKDFEQLIEFNQAITQERNTYLRQELKENKIELSNIQIQLLQLNEQRAKQLEFLKESELVVKFREANQEISLIQAEILDFERQKENIQKVLELKKEQRDLQLSLNNIRNKMEDDLANINNSEDSLFSQIRIYFNEIIHKVLNKEGVLFVALNENSGNFEFRAEYQESGQNTNESLGNTYRKFLCIAFDLAISRAYFNKNFPKFIYIDGVFDGLDDRKKDLLLEVLREYSNLGIQIIATTINSEVIGLTSPITEQEIVLTLHDDGQDGRLFKIPTW